jgi:hypothetical protein
MGRKRDQLYQTSGGLLPAVELGNRRWAHIGGGVRTAPESSPLEEARADPSSPPPQAERASTLTAPIVRSIPMRPLVLIADMPLPLLPC